MDILYANKFFCAYEIIFAAKNLYLNIKFSGVNTVFLEKFFTIHEKRFFNSLRTHHSKYL